MKEVKINQKILKIFKKEKLFHYSVDFPISVLNQFIKFFHNLKFSEKNGTNSINRAYFENYMKINKNLMKIFPKKFFKKYIFNESSF